LKDVGEVVVWIHLAQVGSNSCGHSNEPSDLADYWEFRQKLRNC
jgi:hypothetical protein